MNKKSKKYKSRSLGYRFAMLYRLNNSIISEDLKKLGLSFSHVPVIASLLQIKGTITQEKLSSDLEIDKAATARTLEQLEKMGLVNRKINPENRREKLVSTTDKAKDLSTELFSCLRRGVETFIEGFSKEEEELAYALLDRMIMNARNKKYEKR